MNTNKEMLDKIAELKILHPEAPIIFLVNTETSDEHDYEEQTLKSVEFDVVAKIEKKDGDTLLIAGKENIEDFLEDNSLENEIPLANGNFESVKNAYEKLQKDGIIVQTIIVYLA